MKYTINVFWLIILLFSCSSKEQIKGVVIKEEFVHSPILFETRNSSLHYKQKVNYSFNINGIEYQGEDILGKRLGFVDLNDSILIEYSNSNPDKSKIVGRFESHDSKTRIKVIDREIIHY